MSKFDYKKRNMQYKMWIQGTEDEAGSTKPARCKLRKATKKQVQMLKEANIRCDYARLTSVVAYNLIRDKIINKPTP
jgi:hypothetical protein